eukprot:366088-Chlamydomonas_euryale.AAC.13
MGSCATASGRSCPACPPVPACMRLGTVFIPPGQADIEHVVCTNLQTTAVVCIEYQACVDATVSAGDR